MNNASKGRCVTVTPSGKEGCLFSGLSGQCQTQDVGAGSTSGRYRAFLIIRRVRKTRRHGPME